jgi:hypothetical protein
VALSDRRARLQQQLRALARVSVRVAAVAGLSTLVVLGTAAVRLSRAPIALPVLPPDPVIQEHAGFFNGAVRAVYRHSIVPGGVYSAEEVEAAVLRDPVVAAHYAKLDRSRLVGTVLERPRAMYVSYRVGQRTGWTTRPITLPAGEPLLTDGTRAIRARCGNLVSDTGGEQGVADASGERVDPAEFDQRLAPPLAARGPEPGAGAPAPSLAPGDVLPGAGGIPIQLGTGGPGPVFVPVPGVLPFVIGGGEPPGDSGGPTTTTTGTVGPPTTTTTGVVGPPATTTTTGTVPPPTTTTTGTVPPTTTSTTGVVVPPTTTTTTTGSVPPTTTTTTTGGPPTTTTTTGVIVPPTTTSTVTTFTPTTSTPTTGSVPEPTRLALLVLAWAVYRYTRRAN